MNVSGEPSESSLVETSHCHKGEESWSIIHSSLRHANQRKALQFHSHQGLQLTSLSLKTICCLRDHNTTRFNSIFTKPKYKWTCFSQTWIYLLIHFWLL